MEISPCERLGADGTAKAGTRIIALALNLSLMAVSFWLATGPLFGFYPKPSLWMMAIQVGLPWAAVAAVCLFPRRFSLFPVGPSENRLFLVGLLFFAALAPLGAYHYTSPVRKLPVIELACVVGLILFASLATAEVRAKGNPLFLVMALPLSLGYGYAATVQLNCLLDRSPVTVYQSLLSHKSTGLRGGWRLRIEPWGPGTGARSLMSPYTVGVSREVFDSINDGGLVCVVQRDGALGISWYTAQACPWTGGPVVLGFGDRQ